MSDILESLQARADGVDQFYGYGDEALDREAIAEIKRLQTALTLASNRLVLLLRAECPDSDHPVATKYVINRIQAALNHGQNACKT